MKDLDLAKLNASYPREGGMVLSHSIGRGLTEELEYHQERLLNANFRIVQPTDDIITSSTTPSEKKGPVSAVAPATVEDVSLSQLDAVMKKASDTVESDQWSAPVWRDVCAATLEATEYRAPKEGQSPSNNGIGFDFSRLCVMWISWLLRRQHVDGDHHFFEWGLTDSRPGCPVPQIPTMNSALTAAPNAFIDIAASFVNGWMRLGTAVKPEPMELNVETLASSHKDLSYYPSQRVEYHFRDRPTIWFVDRQKFVIETCFFIIETAIVCV